MSATTWALLLKPFVGIVILAMMWYVPRIIASLIKPLFPNGRLKDALFRDTPINAAESQTQPQTRRLK